MNVVLAKRVLELLLTRRSSRAATVNNGRILHLAQECLGEDLLRFPDGRMLIWNIARHDGYNIPPYPMAGCGDVREFLADEGVRNVPEWYARHLGIERELYDRIYEYELVMVRNRQWWRKVFVVPMTVFEHRSDCGGPLLEELITWIAFSLGTESNHDDPQLFRR